MPWTYALNEISKTKYAKNAKAVIESFSTKKQI